MPPYPHAMDRFPRLRQSTLAHFDRCALSARFEREHLRDWSTHPQARGTIFHRVAAECLKTMHRERSDTISTAEAIEILHEALAQRDVDERCGICGADAAFRAETGRVHCDNGHDHGSSFVNIPFSEVKDLRWVTIKFAHDNSFDISTLVDVEQRLMAKVAYPDPEGGSVERLLTGQLDALFVVGDAAEHAIVLDWKDTWALPAPTEVGFDGYFQQRFYAYLVLRNYPSVERVTLREMYVRHSEVREADVWRTDLDDVAAELGALAERFDRAWEQGNFPPTPGRHCQMCPLPDKCPIFPSVRGEGAVQDAATAARYARELTVARRAAKVREDALKGWTDVHGPQPISDHKGPRVIGYRKRKRTARPDRETMQQALALAGADSALDLDELYRTTAQTRFEEFTPTEEDATDEAERERQEADLMRALEQSVARQRPGQSDAA